MNKLLFEIDRKGHVGISDMKGNTYTLIRFIGSIIDQHPGICHVIEKAVMRSSLRLKIYRQVETELQNEAFEVQRKLKAMINSQPGLN